MRRSRFGGLVATAVLLAVPAMAEPPAQPPAETPGAPSQSPREMLESGAEMILRAFELMLKTIPQYEAPEVLPNGDIIIRRKQPFDADPAEPPKDKPQGGVKT